MEKKVFAQVHTAKIHGFFFFFGLHMSAFSSISNTETFYIIPDVRVLSTPSIY